MGKPRMIILIRHAQSEGNKNREIHQHIPDHRVKLTSEGLQQAEEAGRRLRHLLRPDDTIRFYTSPYRRTRETTEGILSTLTSNDPDPTPFPRDSVKVYEEPRLREQDFGNFQPCSAEMERMWQERADYGHFFYRIPNGESAADAYDRVSGFNESLWRSIGEDDFPSVCVLVTHGLMTRVFLMKWYHWSVEHFEDLRNVNHCEFIIMNKNPESGKYYLEKELRTWSELKQRAAALDAVNVDNNGSVTRPTPQTAQSPILRRWGGCAFGCDHDKINFPRRVRRRDTSDIMNGNGNVSKSAEKTSQPCSLDGNMSHPSHHTYHQTSENGSLFVNEEPSAPPQTTPKHKRDVMNSNFNQAENLIPEEPTGLAFTQPAFTPTQNRSSEQNDSAWTHDGHKMGGYLYVDGGNDNGDFLSATPAVLQLGRDGGGSLSGAASPTGIKSEVDDYFIPTSSLARTAATAASPASQQSPPFSSSNSVSLATALAPHQSHGSLLQQQQQQQTQHQNSSTKQPPVSSSSLKSSSSPSSSSPAAAAAAEIASSSSSYQPIPETWTAQSGMGTGAQAEPLGDYGDDGASMTTTTEANGMTNDANENESGKTENLVNDSVRGKEGVKEGGNLRAVQRAEERAHSVGESVY